MLAVEATESRQGAYRTRSVRSEPFAMKPWEQCTVDWFCGGAIAAIGTAAPSSMFARAAIEGTRTVAASAESRLALARGGARMNDTNRVPRAGSIIVTDSASIGTGIDSPV